jgi:hypothetical protein
MAASSHNPAKAETPKSIDATEKIKKYDYTKTAVPRGVQGKPTDLSAEHEAATTLKAGEANLLLAREASGAVLLDFNSHITRIHVYLGGRCRRGSRRWVKTSSKGRERHSGRRRHSCSRRDRSYGCKNN